MSINYIWKQAWWHSKSPQLGDAPAFVWQKEQLEVLLEQLRLLQSRLLALAGTVSAEQQEAELETIVQNALRTSEIEGEVLNAESVRSSVIHQLGLKSAGFVTSAKHRETPQSRALINLLIEATGDHQSPLSTSKLCNWQSALFPEPPRYHSIAVGALRGEAPMQVVSGRIDNPKIHFEAPPREGLEQDLERFCDWYNLEAGTTDGFIRAGIAHLWFLTLHPFDDGNGRIARALTDKALAQAESQSVRFYSLSAAIMARRKQYYELLEQSQKGNSDITPWLAWFLSVLGNAMEQGLVRFDRVLSKSRFWQRHAQTALNERQIKLLNRLLDTQGEEFVQGISASKYGSLVKVSKATATRELADLLAKQCIYKLPGGGRSTRYAVYNP